MLNEQLTYAAASRLTSPNEGLLTFFLTPAFHHKDPADLCCSQATRHVHRPTPTCTQAETSRSTAAHHVTKNWLFANLITKFLNVGVQHFRGGLQCVVHQLGRPRQSRLTEGIDQ